MLKGLFIGIFIVAASVLVFGTLSGWGDGKSIFEKDVGATPAQDVQILAVQECMRHLRPEAQAALINYWVPPSPMYLVSYETLRPRMPSLKKETFDDFSRVSRSPASLAGLIPLFPRCELMDEATAMGSIQAEGSGRSVLDDSGRRLEGTIALTNVAFSSDRRQALVYVGTTWVAGGGDQSFFLYEHRWHGWKKAGEWKFGRG